MHDVQPVGRPGPADLVQAACQVRSLDQLGGLLRSLHRRHARRNLGSPLTVRELARQSGYSHAAVAEYLSGRTLPPTDRFDVLTGLLGASPPERGALATARDRVEERRRGRVAGPLPRELPPRTPGFTGRDRELAELDAGHLPAGGGAGPSTPLTLITGTAGVGKTALAVEWATRAAGRFPDGQLYVDLRGYATESPLTPLQVLARFLPALGVPPGQVPHDLDRAVAAYRSRLADRRVLVLLDNAADAAQVRPLLPGGSGCVVLVTSRDRLVGLVARDGARPLRLDVLSTGDAKALVAGLASAALVAAEPAAAHELVGLCGRLPLALRIAAANLSTGPAPALTTFAAQLRGADRLALLAVPGDPDAAVAGAFGLSYCRLPEPARRTFRRLGLLPGPDATIGAVAALAGAAPDEAGRDLAALTAAHLVEEHLPGRYACHDLLRLYAQDRVRREEGPAGAAAALERLYRFYHRTADAATSVLYPEALRLPAQALGRERVGPEPRFGDHREAVDWLDRELPNLVAAVQHAAVQQVPTASWLISNGLRGYLQQRAPAADAELVLDAALAAARRAGDRRAEGCVRLGRTVLRLRRGDPAGALADSAEALAACRDVGWPDGQAAATANLSAAHDLRGELRQAAERSAAAAALFEQAGSRDRLAIQLADLAVTLLKLGRPEPASRAAQRVADLVCELDSDYLRAHVIGRLGGLRWLLGDLIPARRCLLWALAHYRRCGDRAEASSTLSGLAEVQCDLGRLALAQQLGTAGLRIAQQLQFPRKEVRAQLALSRVHQRKGRVAAAEQAAARARTLAQELGDRYAQCRAWLALAEAQRLSPSGHPAAWTSVDRALQLARSGEFQLLEAQALALSAETWCATGDTGRAVAGIEGTASPAGSPPGWSSRAGTGRRGPR